MIVGAKVGLWILLVVLGVFLWLQNFIETGTIAFLTDKVTVMVPSWGIILARVVAGLGVVGVVGMAVIEESQMSSDKQKPLEPEIEEDEQDAGGQDGSLESTDPKRGDVVDPLRGYGVPGIRFDDDSGFWGRLRKRRRLEQVTEEVKLREMVLEADTSARKARRKNVEEQTKFAKSHARHAKAGVVAGLEATVEEKRLERKQAQLERDIEQLELERERISTERTQEPPEDQRTDGERVRDFLYEKFEEDPEMMRRIRRGESVVVVELLKRHFDEDVLNSTAVQELLRAIGIRV